MAQIRFQNYKRPLISYDENLRLFGSIAPGRICGFDTMTIVGGNTLSIAHAITGWVSTNLDGSAHSIRGITQSRQGNFIHEDAAIQINVDFNATANDRIDLFVMEHTFLDSPGGAAATYSIIKGVLTGAQEPALSNSLLQVIVGRFLIKAGAVDHTNTVYEPAEPRMVGGANALTKYSENEIQDGTSIVNPGRVIVGAQTLGDFNRLAKTGMFRLITTLNRPTTDTNEWFVLVMRKGNQVVQLALSKLTGKIYTRSSADIGATWQAWQNLNNSDITNLIGDLNYASNNFITDGDIVTTALSELDAAIANQIAAVNATITSEIGNRDYPGYLLTDGESLTTSLGKLDTAWLSSLRFAGNINGAGNPNYPVGLQGEVRLVGVAGKIGGAAGKVIKFQDLVVCILNSAAGDEATVGSSWVVLVNGNLAGLLSAANGAVGTANIAAAAVDSTKVDSSVFVMPHSITDFNDVKKAALTGATGAQANAPVAGAGNHYLLIATEDGVANGNTTQIAIQTVGGVPGTWYYRLYTGLTVTWSAWVVINNP